MGSSNSSLSEPLVGYKFPTDRLKMRQVRNYPTDPDAVQYDPAADKYDYLIIFKRPVDKGVGALNDPLARTRTDEYDSDDDAAVEDDGERISWVDIEQMWFQATPGDEDKKMQGVEWLRREWIGRFRTDMVSSAEGGDRIPKSAFESMVRAHVCDQLRARTGLQLKLSISPSGEEVYCLIRAPMGLLERKADELEYKLKFRGGIDPGHEFWQKWADHDKDGKEIYVEIDEERGVYEKNKANEILEELYYAGKISANDMQVFDEEEPTKQHWSRRVHALERVADRVPVSSLYPAYAAFSTKRHLRHLYAESNTVRGRTLFRSKDRLYLTKRIIDEVFDFGVFVEKDVIVAITALHDASHGEAITTTWFQKTWVFYFWASADSVGAPCVSHEAIEPGVAVSWYLYPWSQPLMEIRDYFGEKISLYFAWLGFYGHSLMTPVLGGTAVSLYQWAVDIDVTKPGFHWDQIVFAFFIVIWGAHYKESWDVESQYCAVKWGTLNFEEEELDRPQFTGDPECPRRRSPITNQNETYYPDSKRTSHRIYSFLLVFLMIFVLVTVIVGVFYLEWLVYSAGLQKEAGLMSFVQAALIKFASDVYAKVAIHLNDEENYRTQTSYENNLIFKKFLFEIFNNYSALCFSAFFKGSVFVCLSGNDDCLGDTEQLLYTIVLTRFVYTIWSALSGRVYSTWTALTSSKSAYNKKRRAEEETTAGNPMLSETEEEPRDDKLKELETPRFEAEIALETYDGTFDDYAEIVLQMGLVLLWSQGWVFLPFFAMLETLLQIRVDAYKLAALTRRPDPILAETVGSWSYLMELMGLLAVYSNAGLIVYSTSALAHYSFFQRLLIFFVLEQLILLAKVLTHMLTPNEPLALLELKKRQAHVVSRHLHAVFYDDVQDSDKGNDVEKKGNVDRDLLDASALGGVEELSPQTLRQLDWLRQKLVSCDSDIKIARQQYKLACRTEIFREDLGVSYSRHTPDLALGMVTLTVLEAENVGSRSLPIDPKNVRCIVHIRDTRQNKNDKQYEGNPGPSPLVSKPAKRPAGKQDVKCKDGSRMVFNQSFSLAPIKTAHAEIFIELMDESRKTRCGSTAIPLADIANQKKQSLTLSITKPAGGAVHSDHAVLYAKVQFQYSKILPIKHRIYMLLEEQRKIHRDITNLQLGKGTERAWDFPSKISNDQRRASLAGLDDSVNRGDDNNDDDEAPH